MRLRKADVSFAINPIAPTVGARTETQLPFVRSWLILNSADLRHPLKSLGEISALARSCLT
jgi:hypothetical protein